MNAESQNKKVSISESMYRAARCTAEAEHRTIGGQIEYWAELGRAAADNPDLPIDLVRDILVSRSMGRVMAEPFVPEKR